MKHRTLVSILSVSVIVALAVAVHITQAQPATTKPAAKPTKEQVTEKKLDEVARVASVLVDGELCLDIVTDRAERLLFEVNPRDPYAASDNYDVNLKPFMQVKKLLGRMALLVDFPVDCNLVMRCKVKPEKLQTVIRQYHGWSQCYVWGAKAYDPTPEMKRVLETGERVVLRSDRWDHLSVIAPVKDSLGEIVGIVEVCTRTERWDSVDR